MKLCECGCGREVKNRFVSGHNKSMLGKYHTEETKRKLREVWKRRVREDPKREHILAVLRGEASVKKCGGWTNYHWVYGRNNPEGYRKKMSKAGKVGGKKAHGKPHPWCAGSKNHMHRPESKAKFAEYRRNGAFDNFRYDWENTPLWKKKLRAEKISLALKGKPKPWLCGDKNPSKRSKVKRKIREYWQNPIHRNNQRVKQLEHWGNPENRENRLRAIFAGCKLRPTSVERRFMEICEKYNLPFRYCGDGSLLIGFKNPDFVESNGRKICLEVFGKYWHEPEDEGKRIKHFGKHGWKCLVIWEDELKDKDCVANRVKGAVL